MGGRTERENVLLINITHYHLAHTNNMDSASVTQTNHFSYCVYIYIHWHKRVVTPPPKKKKDHLFSRLSRPCLCTLKQSYLCTSYPIFPFSPPCLLPLFLPPPQSPNTPLPPPHPPQYTHHSGTLPNITQGALLPLANNFTLHIP